MNHRLPKVRRASGIGRRWALVSLLLLLPVSPGVSAQQGAPAGGGQDVAGEWEGVLETPNGPLGILVTLERTDAGLAGRFSLPAEGVRDVPAAAVETRGDSLVLTFAADRVYRGQLAGDSVAGLAHMNSGELAMVLFRAGSPGAERVGARLEAALAAARAAPLEAVATGPGLDRVEAAALDRLVAAAGEAHSHALVVLHDGDLVGAWYAGGEREKIEAMSATKSVVNLAVGRLITTGALESIDVPVHTFYPEWSTGPESRVTIRHLLNHTSGIRAERTTQAIYASDDFVRFALDAGVGSEPGTEAFYNNSATNLLAGVVGKVAGRRMDLFLRDDLFARLGITDFGWSLDPAGNPHGMAGLQVHPEDLARLGQLVLQRGEWEGERLIDEVWFDLSMSPGSELTPGGGLLWWLIRDGEEVVGFRADGYLGQFLVVYPSEGLVGVRMVASSPAYDPDTDGFRDFQDLLRALRP